MMYRYLQDWYKVGENDYPTYRIEEFIILQKHSPSNTLLIQSSAGGKAFTIKASNANYGRTPEIAFRRFLKKIKMDLAGYKKKECRLRQHVISTSFLVDVVEKHGKTYEK